LSKEIKRSLCLTVRRSLPPLIPLLGGVLLFPSWEGFSYSPPGRGSLIPLLGGVLLFPSWEGFSYSPPGRGSLIPLLGGVLLFPSWEGLGVGLARGRLSLLD